MQSDPGFFFVQSHMLAIVYYVVLVTTCDLKRKFDAFFFAVHLNSFSFQDLRKFSL